MFDDDSSWFRRLKAMGQSQTILTYAQINENIPQSVVQPEEIEKIVEELKKAGIRVVPDATT